VNSQSVLQHDTYNINGVTSSVCYSTILHAITVCPFFFPNARNKGEGGQRLSQTVPLCSKNIGSITHGTQHTPIFLMVKGYSKSLSQINTLAVPTLLTTNMPLRWNTASPVKSFGSRRLSCTAHKKQLQKCIFSKLPSLLA
jgi:hypothetical protein